MSAMRGYSSHPLHLIIASVLIFLSGCAPAAGGWGSPMLVDYLTGRELLLSNTAEPRGYGLYSYVVFGSPPSPSTRARYLAALEAFDDFSTVQELRRYRTPEQLNVLYLPVSKYPSQRSADALLSSYDYTRSRILLRNLRGSRYNLNPGPYLVSSKYPLTRGVRPNDSVIVQDLSSVPPHLVNLWMREFFSAVESETEWDTGGMNRLILRLRTNIGRLAEGFPAVQKAMTALVSWIRPLQ